MSLGPWGHLYIPYVMGLGASVHLSAILCLSVHSFATQFITVMPVALHHCGLLLYWTGCLWMYAQLHAVDLFFSLLCFHYVSGFFYNGCDCCCDCGVLWYIISPHNCYHGPLLDGASSDIRPAYCGSTTTTNTKECWRCCWPCHCATVATSVSEASSSLCQLCYGSSTGRFLF